MAREHVKARLLMTTPAVGPIVALTYAGAIDDPSASNPPNTSDPISD